MPEAEKRNPYNEPTANEEYATMRKQKPNRQAIIGALRRLRDKSPDGRVGQRMLFSATGLSKDDFWEYWPQDGVRGAYAEAGVEMRNQFGKGEHKRKEDSEVAQLLRAIAR